MIEIIKDKFKNIYKEISARNNIVYLFMIIKMDEYTDKWSVVVCVKSNSFQEDFNSVAELCKRYLSEEEQSTLARIGIFKPTDYLVNIFTTTITTNINNNDDPIKLENTRVNGYEVHEAYIYKSMRVLKE